MTASARPKSTSSPVAGPKPTHRLATLPTYVFAWLDELKAAARARGAELIDLGIGNPDQPTPPAIIDAITQAFRAQAAAGYPPIRGESSSQPCAIRFL